MSNEYTTEQLKTNVEGWVPAPYGIFTPDVDYALISLSDEELSYTITKLQYKWTVAAAGKDAVFWDVVFHPSSNAYVGHNQQGWPTNQQTESQVYTVDPTTLNGKDEGIYTVELQPNDVIQINSFIPQEWVAEPSIDQTLFVDNGNSRKTPLDASFTTGSAIYGREFENKLRHRQSLTVLADADPGSAIEAGTAKPMCGPTREYRYSDLVDGHIPTGLQPVNSATATPTVVGVTIQHPAEGIVTIVVEDKASDPIVFGSFLAPIHFRVQITIDRSDPGHARAYASGTHSRFPAYEVWVNNRVLHVYSPIPDGVGVEGLFDFDFNFDNNETLE